MDNQVKVNVTRMEDMNLISRTYVVEGKGRDSYHTLSSDFHTHIMACLCPLSLPQTKLILNELIHNEVLFYLI